MRIAVKWDQAVVDADGKVSGREAGDTLVRRLLRIFPESILIGPANRRCEGFDMVPLEFIDPKDTVIINMDVVDSPKIWQILAKQGDPKIMNFMWWPVNKMESDVGLASLGLSCGLFPTFANSERTANEVREMVEMWTVQRIYERAKIGWVNLGFRLSHVQERVEPENPIVLYPAIYLSSRKRPEDFLEAVEWVRKKVPIKVEMRLHESHLVSEMAMKFSRRDWIWVGPLTARTGYWQALARTTAFLATTDEESYGLEYVEALGAGVVGIFPDKPWAHALLPEGYPFIYKNMDEAKQMLLRAVTDAEACRKEINACAGGSMLDWLGERHSDAVFDKAVVKYVNEWFGK